MKPSYYFGAVQIIIGIFITIFIESVASGSLLFTEGILAEGLRKSIIERPKTAIGILLSIHTIAYLIYQRTTNTEKSKIVYNNICRAIFDSYIKDDLDIDNTQIRVTVFKAFHGYKFIGKMYTPKICTYLCQVGRHQSVQDKKNCKIHFLPNEGCVGICYNTAQVIHQEVAEYNEKKRENYYKNNEKVFNLNKRKIKRLNESSCSFLAFPINYFNSDDVFGVIIFDSTQKGKIEKFKTRELEEKVLNYSVFFNQNKDN